MSTQTITVMFKFKVEYDKQEFKAKKKHAAAAITNSAEANPSEQAVPNP